MDSFFIRPACPGADIRDPATGERLPAGGADKPRDPYWVALEIRGDVVAGEPDPEPAAASAAEASPPAKPDKKPA